MSYREVLPFHVVTYQQDMDNSPVSGSVASLAQRCRPLNVLIATANVNASEICWFMVRQAKDVSTEASQKLAPLIPS